MVPGEEEWGFQILTPNSDGTPRFAPVIRDIFTKAFRDEVSRTVIAMIRERAQIGICYTREQHLALIPQVAMIMRDVWNEVVVQTSKPGLVAQVFDVQANLMKAETIAVANPTNAVVISGPVAGFDGLMQPVSLECGSGGVVGQRKWPRNTEGPYQRPKCSQCGKKHDGVCLAGKCFNCGIKGHFSRSCPKPQGYPNQLNLMTSNRLKPGE